MPRLSGKRVLPLNPHLDHLRKDAKQLLADLRLGDPTAQLSDAQFALARDYGFASWRALKAAIERQQQRTLPDYEGFYRHDPAQIRNQYLAVSVEGAGLSLQPLQGGRITLERQDDGHFAAPGLSPRYGFERDDFGAVTALRMEADGRQSRLARISMAEAQAIREAHALALKAQQRPRLPVPQAKVVLERHVGHYISNFGQALEIGRDGMLLWARPTGQPQVSLQAQSDCDFFLTLLPAQIVFLVKDGITTGLEMHQNGLVVTMARATAAEAQAVGAGIAARLAEQVRPRVAVAITAQIAARYAGRYRVDDKRVLVVEAEADRLFAQVTGQSRHEVYAESETQFFWTVTAAQVAFIIGKDGLVRHAVLHQVGREIPLARLAEVECAA